MGVDEKTLKEVSYEKGKILVVTESNKKIEGQIQLDLCGKRNMVTVVEE